MYNLIQSIMVIIIINQLIHLQQSLRLPKVPMLIIGTILINSLPLRNALSNASGPVEFT